MTKNLTPEIKRINYRGKHLTQMLLAGFAVFASAQPILAQEARSSQNGASDEEDYYATLINLDAITVFGTRQTSQLTDIAKNITVVTGDELDDQFIGDMGQLTRYTPGVFANRQTTSTDPFDSFGGFTIRGVGGNRVQMLVDGTRVPERITDGTRDYLDFNFTKQVDIVHGPGSVLWGADALGGIVAMETIDPEDILSDGKEKGGELELSYDSFDNRFNNSGTYAQRINDSFSLLAGLSYTHANEPELSNARADGGAYGCTRNIGSGATPCNELNPTGKNTYRGLVKAVVTPNEDSRFEIAADYMRRRVGVDFNSILGMQYSTMTGLPTGEVVDGYKRDLDLYRGRFAIEHDLTLDNRFVDDIKWSLAYSPNGYERTGTKELVNTLGENVREEDTLKLSEDFFEFDMQMTSRVDRGALGHTITWGFDGDRTLTDYERKDVTHNLTTGTRTEERGGGFNFANATTTRADLYVQDQISMFDNRFEVTPGMRFAHYNLDPRADSDYEIIAGAEPRKVSSNKMVYSLGAKYKLTDQYSIYGAFNQGFKMPTAQQLYTSRSYGFYNLIPAPNLQPEKVNTYELGLRGHYAKGNFSLTGFYSEYDGFIQSFYNPPGTSDYTYRNLSSVTLYGIEFAGSWQVMDNLRADASLAWQYGTQKATATSASVPHTTPPLKAVMGLNYQLPNYDLSLDAVATLASSVTRTESDDDFRPGGYALLDVFGKWQPKESLELRFGVKNIFDRRYFEDAASSYGATASTAVAFSNPLELQTGAGRTFQASLKYKF
ncbi:TonB-dependent hemoglobin/transferrin/lactoferrin family receptor [Cohaesibacter haloalkalitolerans]|uniref:TonB-dependent hemoglobin/transferrin/lactoferrin family receptor n=1 Tax=Cohaesibacter haloalkalitolerans TaxID=1162980 RepID=UPI0013C4DCF0|nr:TonB-dependent hemoglobin/transferrin/lactoferrin family receptor [Cohaesibacter haloalkalitolerans]